MKTSTSLNYRKHLLCWTAYAVYFYLINMRGSDEIPPLTVLFTVPYFALVFYTVLYILKTYYAQGKFLMGSCLLIAFYVASGLLIYIVLYGGPSPLPIYGRYVEDHLFSWRAFLQSIRAMLGHFSILAFLYYHYQGKLDAVRGKLAEAERRIQVQEEKLQYEYSALAGQVSPHMLANIFHSWSQQLKETMPKMAMQVALTYDLMKFYMKAQAPGGSDTVLLQDEVKAVENFLAIQQETMGSKIQLFFHREGSFSGYVVPPTTLLTLVENAFKHGDLHQTGFPLRISVRMSDACLIATVQNRQRIYGTGLTGHGYGLRNLRRRLAIVFGQRATLQIRKTTVDYGVTLTINF